MLRAFQLGYLELISAQLDQEVRHYERIIGATLVEQAGGTAYLSLGLDHHNIALVSGARPGLGAIGLRVQGEELPDVAKKLSSMGIGAELKSDARAGVPQLLTVAVGGIELHLYQEMAATAPGFRDAGIAPNRLGHVAVLSADADKLVTFVVDVLGFKHTDEFKDVARFLTCNRDHHVLNIVSAPVSKLHHVAFELRDRGQHVEAADILAANRIETLWGPARHTAGHNLAAYHFSPSRFLVELYVDMDIFIPELNWFEPRPWHETLPLRPRAWSIDQITTWGTKYEFDFLTV
jgi:catechol 2,3-dioxygenase-like lactoylglutathione lyase family enzyme